jgi:hypothetical protein
MIDLQNIDWENPKTRRILLVGGGVVVVVGLWVGSRKPTTSNSPFNDSGIVEQGGGNSSGGVDEDFQEQLNAFYEDVLAQVDAVRDEFAISLLDTNESLVSLGESTQSALDMFADSVNAALGDYIPNDSLGDFSLGNQGLGDYATSSLPLSYFQSYEPVGGGDGLIDYSNYAEPIYSYSEPTYATEEPMAVVSNEVASPSVSPTPTIQNQAVKGAFSDPQNVQSYLEDKAETQVYGITESRAKSVVEQKKTATIVEPVSQSDLRSYIRTVVASLKPITSPVVNAVRVVSTPVQNAVQSSQTIIRAAVATSPITQLTPQNVRNYTPTPKTAAITNTYTPPKVSRVATAQPAPKIIQNKAVTAMQKQQEKLARRVDQ